MLTSICLVTLENGRASYLLLAHSMHAQLTANEGILINVTSKKARGHSDVSFGSGRDGVSAFSQIPAHLQPRYLQLS